jgi:hypothetical protein
MLQAKTFIPEKSEVGCAILPDDLLSPHDLDVPMKLLASCMQLEMRSREVRDAETIDSSLMAADVAKASVAFKPCFSTSTGSFDRHWQAS